MTVISLNKSKQQIQNQDQATIFEIVTNQNPNENKQQIILFC